MKYIVDGIVGALLVLVGIVNYAAGEYAWGVAIIAAAAAYLGWSLYRYGSDAPPKEPEETDRKAAVAFEEWQQRGYDGEVGPESVPLPGDDVPVVPVTGEPDLDRWDDTDIEILKGLWRNEAHRRERPDCIFCLSLDERAKAEGWE